MCYHRHRSKVLHSQILSGLSRIATVLRHEAWASAGREQVSPTQAQILALLYSREHEGIRLGDVARSLAVTDATASDAVRVLEEKLLLCKKPSAKDRRVVLLRLSARGKKVARKVAQWPDFLLAAVETMTPVEQGVFRVALIKMVRELQQQGRIPVARMCSHCSYFRPYVYDDSRLPHHCLFVDAPFGNPELRLDCTDFEAAAAEQQELAWQEFVHIKPASTERGAES